jgi:hypothetical protein
MTRTLSEPQGVEMKMPIGRRIGEILAERGDAYSIRGFSQRIGINRETLRTIISGERPAVPSELKWIADGLDLALERIKQTDTRQDEQKLIRLLDARTNLLQALPIAEGLVSKAIGMTERCVTLNNLGRVLFMLRRYPEAHRAWLAACRHAKSIHAKYEEADVLFQILCNLMISYSMRPDYEALLPLLSEVEQALEDDPGKQGAIYYAKGRIAEHARDLVGAKEYAYLALGSFQASCERFRIGQAEINVAHYEYLDQNYHRALQVLESAILHLRGYQAFELIAVKEYAKTLLRLKQRTRAKCVLSEFLPSSKAEPELESKLYILLSMATNDVQYAQQVAHDNQRDRQARLLACKYLISRYKAQYDSASLLKYYEMADDLSDASPEFLDKEVI